MIKPLVIGGGVGPMAGVALHARVIEQTRTDGTDQSHLCVLHFSCSERVPDRTQFLLGKGTVNPALGMVQVFQGGWEALKALGFGDIGAVGGIPCNTFHAPAIYGPFLSEIQRRSIRVQVVHMLEETVGYLRDHFPGVRRVGVLSTTGTRKTGVYRSLLEAKGFQMVEVGEEWQDKVQEAIYHPAWGIKARSSPVTDTARERVLESIRLLMKQGAEAVVLGCTELPLAVPGGKGDKVPLIDPMVALARAMIREAAPEKLAPI